MAHDHLATVLAHLLRLHPGPLTIAEVVRDLTFAPTGFADEEATESAIRELLAAGLLHRHGELVLPTRAAVRFDELFAVSSRPP